MPRGDNNAQWESSDESFNTKKKYIYSLCRLPTTHQDYTQTLTHDAAALKLCKSAESHTLRNTSIAHYVL